MFRFNFNSEDNIIANTDTISTIDTSGKPEECLVKLAEEIRICEEKVEKIIQQTRSSQEKFNTFVSKYASLIFDHCNTIKSLMICIF